MVTQPVAFVATHKLKVKKVKKPQTDPNGEAPKKKAQPWRSAVFRRPTKKPS